MTTENGHGRWRFAAFDWNGTLCDDKELAWRSTRHIFEHHGIPAPAEEIFFDEITANFIEWYRKYGLPAHVAPQELNAIRRKYFEDHWHDASLREGAADLLEFCYMELGIPLIVVSGEHTPILMRRLEHYRIRKYFTEVHGDTWDKVAVFREALRRFEAEDDPASAFYIDDSCDGNDAADRLRMTTFALSCGYTRPAKLASVNSTHTVGSLGEVLTKLQAMRRAA